MEKDAFKGQSIAIIGSGNAAYEIANYLNDVTESIAVVGPAKFAWKTHYPGHLRSVNMGFLDTLYLKAGNIIYMNDYAAEDAILFQHEFLQNHQSRLHAVIYCGGFEFDSSIFDSSCIPDLMYGKSGYPLLNERFESQNVKNMYFVGALMQASDYKIGTSSFIHGFRYNIKFLHTLLHGGRFTTKLHNTFESLYDHVILQMNTSSCLHHRFKYFCDVIVIYEDRAEYFESIYIPYFKSHTARFIGQHVHSFILLYMDYGNGSQKEFDWNIKQAGGFSQIDIVIPFRDAVSKFLHPVFEIYHIGDQNDHVQKFHVGENPTGQFYHIIHTRLVAAYLKYAFSAAELSDICEVEQEVVQTYWLHVKRLHDLQRAVS